ncbi:diazepam-binding inhibitor (GABA receptor modulator, acyl-CoA-binding protein) [Fonticula alba]|uniref:Diazepam-binding inhibitor (GABA receptor modulator, acyl-CoA-binding protein) n=1 Tax=Fonticula alba TaxID=691883 RepID=A0A058Z426_FONAL|nr:diazepam-binding inhibitor (GABA receptor modulator, acyl-CoA-binding protein) [Fonticula alba]KCV69024.1 diazepam-binding inhibitor (GABA receptor modulator, acyl-CoA-binding protein) [Fonticula alba]|eukprot:XP_009496595.1 diazepam-binding inhibitor (GABA receptor modulator, acyl-CoA-binding protein) [Fonticula alba]
MSLADKFATAEALVKKLKSRPSNDELLTIYANYKQSTVGDVDTACPGLFDVSGRAKWNAWNALKGTDKDTAMQTYVDTVDSLVQKYGTE